MGSAFWRLSLAVLGIAAFVAIGIALQGGLGIPFETTYRVACAFACLGFIAKVGSDYPGERWPRIGIAVALLVNVGVFFTPLVDRPASRGEIMLFALPDAVILLIAWIATYRVVDVHQRAMRQQLILGLIVAVAFCAILFTLTLIQPRGAH